MGNTKGEQLVITDTLIADNIAVGQRGGGIYFWQLGGRTATFALDRCIIQNNACGNSVSADGAGMFVTNCVQSILDGGEPLIPSGGFFAIQPIGTVDNCVFAENVAVLDGNCATSDPEDCLARGGGLAIISCIEPERGFNVDVCNSTFSENEVVVLGTGGGTGGAIRTWGLSALSVKDNILWNDEAAYAGKEIAVKYGAMSVSYSDVKGTQGTCPLGGSGVAMLSGAPQFCGPGNLDVDPSFVDPGNGNFHILPGSLVRNAGDGTGCGLFDMDMDDRVCDLLADMGADEVCD